MRRDRYKRSIAVLLLSAVLVLTAAITGCGKKAAPTAVSLAKTAAEKMDALKSASLEENLEMDAGIGMQGMTVDMKMNMMISGDVLMEPYTSHMRAKMDMEALGQTQTVKTEIYSERDGDMVATYTTQDGSTWIRDEQKMTDETMAQMMNLNIYDKIADGTIEAELAEETQKIGDQEVYVLSFAMADDQLESVLESSLGAAGDAASMFSNVDLTGVSAPAVVYIDKESGYPVRMEMDMSQLGAALFENALGASGGDYEIDVRTFSVRVDMSRFDEIGEINIPEEVRTSASGEGANQESTPVVLPGSETEADDEGESDYGADDAGSDTKTGDSTTLVSGKSKVEIHIPDGFDELRFSDQYAAASLYDDGAMTDIFYYLYDDISMDEYLDFTDASYMREDADYSNVKIGEIQSGTLGGKEVKWKKTSYDYSSLTFIKYEIGVPASTGNILSIEITCTNDKGTKQWFDEDKLLENVLSHIEIR